MLKNHMSTCKKTHVNMQHLFLMERDSERACERERESERASEREKENERERERVRESERLTPGPYQAPHSPAPKSIDAGREQCTAWSWHDFSIASCAAPCHPRIPAASRLLPSPTPPTCIERFLAAAAGQHGKTAAPPANARSSPRVAGRTQPSTHDSGEKSPPAHGRKGVSPLHALHSSPRQHAGAPSDGRSPPLRSAQRLRLTRIPSEQQQRAPRCPPAETLQCRASTRPRPHPAHADTADTPMHATRDRPTRARAHCLSSGGVRPPGTAQPSAQDHAMLLSACACAA